MLTKGAIGNLVNRYRAVLKKCNLINTFGSLAVASMLVLGGVGVANAAESTITLNGQNATYDASATNPYLNSGYLGTQPNPLTLQGSGTEKVTLAGVGKQCAIASYANGTIHVNNLKELVVNGLWNSTDANVDYDGNVFYAQGAKYDNGTQDGHALVDIDMPNGTLKTDGVLKQAMLFHAIATDTTSAKITVKAKTIDTATTSNSIVAQKNGTVDIDAENISILSTAATTAITLGANALIDINASNGDANITSSTSPALWNMAGGAKIIVNASNDINLKGSKVINADGSNSTTDINAGKNVTITASDQDAIYAKTQQLMSLLVKILISMAE